MSEWVINNIFFKDYQSNYLFFINFILYNFLVRNLHVCHVLHITTITIVVVVNTRIHIMKGKHWQYSWKVIILNILYIPSLLPIIT